MVSDQERNNLMMLNRLSKLLIPRQGFLPVMVAAITRSTTRRRCSLTVLQEEIVQQVWIERINRAQDEESWISDLKTYLIENIDRLNAREAKICALIVPDYEVDQSGNYLSVLGQQQKAKNVVSRFVW